MIKIGVPLTLEPKYSEKMEKYKCKVAEMEDGKIYVDYPIDMSTNRNAFLLDGMQLKVSFVGEDEAVYAFEAEVLGRTKRNIPLLILSYPGDQHLIRVQRRQFVRVDAIVDVAVHPLNEEFAPFTTVTSDISAGGAAIVLPNDETGLKHGMTIEIWLVLHMRSGDYHYLRFLARVVRIFEENVLKASLEFLEVNDVDRLALIRYSFEKQLEMRKKEQLDA
ncbi:putative glycosyltransferase [Anoxybacillus thermarum]|uniref:Putative glycosyltransferase n=1 Tax=Anoxybacillus thermarum TaxID=404937 RepID=A0A0D0QYQ4_9BACL|nr:flagellar brake domain-containing protein [Anoxybacillus thermarum]KIQ94609.1 putative glycosyltransferase [Anoxybacillus thermarum]